MIARTTRKSLLRGAGAAALTGPFLRLLAPARRAAAAGPPKRLVVFATPIGTVMDAFFPGPGFTFGEILAPLEPWKQKLIVMRGIDNKAAMKTPVPTGHRPDFPSALTGYQSNGSAGAGSMGGISIDQQIAGAIGAQTKFKSLQLGVMSRIDYYPLVSAGSGQGMPHENSPQKAFDRLFANLSVASGGTPMMQVKPDPSLERRRLDRLSVLDTVKQDLADVRCQLGAEEKRKLDAHLEAVREVERGLTFVPPAPSGAGCGKPALPMPVSGFQAIGKAQMDIIASALACDLTRVVVLLWHHGSSNLSHTWVNAPGSHHGIAHGSEGVTADAATRRRWLVQIDTWYAQQLAYLLKRLDDIPEAGGRLLDHTAVLWLHEQSDGRTHQRRDMPYVLAGGCGGYFRTGRALALGGVAHSGLLLSLAHALDVPLASFGDPAFAQGPIAALR
jgi:hypothetical protein